MAAKLIDSDLWRLRAMIQKAGWGEFMGHIGSIMAEQADKSETGTEQEINLVECSRTIHALGKFFMKCGMFDYRRFRDTIPAEYSNMFEDL